MECNFTPLFKAKSALALLPLAIAANSYGINPAPAFDAGPFKVIPTLAVKTGQNENLFLTDGNEVDSWETVLTPSVEMVAQKGNDRYVIGYSLSKGVVHSSRDDDFTDHALYSDINLELNSRNTLGISAGLYKNHEPRGTGANQGSNATANAEAVEYDDRVFDIKYTYGNEDADGRLELRAGVVDKEYTNFKTQNAGRDRFSATSGATFYYRVGPKTQALFELRRERINYDLTTSLLDSTEMEYLVGISWEATAKTQGTVKIGYAKKDFASTSLADDSGISWELTARWSPLSYSHVDLSTAKTQDETDGTGSYIERTASNITWTHNWSDRLSSRATAGRRESTYIGSARRDDEDNFGLGLTYNMRRWLDLSVDYVYSDRSSNFSGLAYDNNTVYLTFDVAM